MLPVQAQARKAIWDAVDPHTGKRRIDMAFPKEIRESTRDVDMSIKLLNGSTWQVVGSDSYNSLVGTSPAGLVFSEWALSDPNAWTYLSPIVEENGGWCIWVSTVRGENHCTQMYDNARRDPAWFAQLLKAKDTGVFTEEHLKKIRQELIEFLGEEEGDAKYRQEYENSRTAAIPGAYYASLIQRADDEGRITKVSHLDGFDVHTAWDLGVADDTAIWFFQRIGAVVHLIDYYEARGEGAPHYAGVLQEKARAAGWLYGEHIVPHDARVRDWSTGDSRLTVLNRLGISATVQGTTSLTEKGYLADGIDAVRRILPICYFDAKKCKQGLAALRHYHREWDEDRKTFALRPRHDFASHASDAFRVLAMSRPPAIVSRRIREKRRDSWWAA